MTGKISLTASMRSNLLSLQNISRQVSATQNKLATGNKVNSAIDNPSSYYTARALNNRADDLNALLDSMGQAISTIKAATTALETGAAFLEQAAAVATQTLETSSIPTKSYFESQENVAAVVSDWTELKAALDSGKTGDIVIYGNIEAQDTIILKEGQNLVGVGYYGVNEPDIDKFSSLFFDLEKSNQKTAIELKTDNHVFSDLSIKTKTSTGLTGLINAYQTSNHLFRNMDIMVDTANIPDYDDFMQDNHIVNGGSWTFEGINNFYVPNDTKKCVIHSFFEAKLEVYGQLNFDSGGNPAVRAIRRCTINAYQNSVINLFSEIGLQDCKTNLNDNTTLTTQCVNAVYYLGEGYFNANDEVKINMTSKNAVCVNNPEGKNGTGTFSINSPTASLNLQSGTIFNNSNNKLTLNAVAGASFAFNGVLYQTETAVSDNNVRRDEIPKDFSAVDGAVVPEVETLSWLSVQNAGRVLKHRNENVGSDGEYSQIIVQYDDLMKDASYKGINLLQNDRLNVNFNENRSASLSVQGKDMSSAALGLTTLDWQSQEDVVQAVKELTAALKSIRSFSAELGNNYSIITSRQDFTENLINILTEGADKLTLADMNEESANMLALQTRQQLAVNSLSLASQASQSVLRLF